MRMPEPSGIVLVELPGNKNQDDTRGPLRVTGQLILYRKDQENVRYRNQVKPTRFPKDVPI